MLKNAFSTLRGFRQILGPMTRKWEVGNDPQNKIWEVGDGQKKCGRCIFLKWEVGDEEINVGGGRWIKLLGGLLNGVKTQTMRLFISILKTKIISRQIGSIFYRRFMKNV